MYTNELNELAYSLIYAAICSRTYSLIYSLTGGAPGKRVTLVWRSLQSRYWLISSARGHSGTYMGRSIYPIDVLLSHTVNAEKFSILI